MSAFLQVDNEQLHQKMKMMFEQDFNDHKFDGVGHSQEDLKAMKIIKDSCHLVDGHYQIALPWRRGRLETVRVLPSLSSDAVAR